MKHFYNLIAASLLATTINAQTLTQNLSFEITSEGMYSCVSVANGVTARDNRYFRFFKPVDHGITDAFNVYNVQFGVGVLGTVPETGFPVVVKVYLTQATDFPVGFPVGYEQVANVTVPMFQSDLLQLKTVPMNIPVPAGYNIVMEVGNEDQLNNTNSNIKFGTNQAGETAPFYWSSTGCEPILGGPIILYTNFDPLKKIVMVINGDELAVDDFSTSSVAVYPNPTTGIVNVEISNTIAEKIVISDLQGKRIAEFENSQTIDVSSLHSGCYLLTIQARGFLHQAKLVKN